MASYTAQVSWLRGADIFSDRRYHRNHVWSFDGGAAIPASSSPHHVPAPLSDPQAVDPEEAFIAAVASCHLLSFLILAAKQGFVVESYSDQASGTMGKWEDGKEAITRVALAPHVVFSGDQTPSADAYQALHHAAHDACYIANSIRSEIITHPTWEVTRSAG